MMKKINFDESMYKNINGVCQNNKNEQVMFFAGKVENDGVNFLPSTFKWLNNQELDKNENGTFANETVFAKYVLDMKNKGMDSILMLKSHLCEEGVNDFMFSSLSKEDLESAKKELLIAQFNNVDYYNAISTGKKIYFWSINNNNFTPTPINCYIDGKIVDNKIPSTLQELFDAIKTK